MFYTFMNNFLANRYIFMNDFLVNCYTFMSDMLYSWRKGVAASKSGIYSMRKWLDYNHFRMGVFFSKKVFACRRIACD